MVPPPATGDAFPDFDSMTPEEQMAWLESLAKRQGVKDEELTTAADMEINEVSPDAVIDEPGYVPFEGSVSARRMKEAAEAEAAALAATEAEPVSEELPEAEISSVVSAELEPATVGSEAADDPMQWLNGLSAQPGEDFGELEDVFSEAGAWEENGLLASFDELDELVAMEFVPEEPQPPEPALEAALSQADDDDPLGGIDPMLFLETLAKKQGVNLEELTTTADMEIAEVSPDAVVDEPGYVPFEGSVSARRMKEAAEAEAVAQPQAESVQEPEAEPEVVEAESSLVDEALPDMFADTVATEGVDILSGDTGEMAWLDSLAGQQDADIEELFTSADQGVSELPEDTIIDEPDFVEYSPFGVLSSEEEAELPESGEAETFEESALSWLEDLAAEPDDEFAELFAEVDELSMELEGEEVAGEIALAPQVSDDPLAGMTDEDIARAQAHGELTPQQELAWLKRQAAGLAATRDIFGETDDEDTFEEIELEPAQPGEIPPWLLQMRSEPEDAGQPDAAALFAVDEMAAETLEPAELPGLFEGDEAVIDFDMAELALDSDELSPADVSALWAEEPASAESDLSEISPDSELAAFIKGDLVPEADPLAEALDAEFERRMLGDDTEPEWYLQAKERVEAGALAMPEVEQPSQVGEASSEPVVAPAEPVDMPDWLKDRAEQPAAVQADDMPDWLAGKEPVEPASEGVMPDWLTEEAAPAVEEADMPDWLMDVDAGVVVEAVEEPSTPGKAKSVIETPSEPKSVPAEPVREPAPRVVAPVQPEVAPLTPPAIPEGELFAQYRQRLEADPHDHASRLALARALLGQNQLMPSLDQYEALIQSSHLLQDVANDLTNLVNAQSDVPRVRRLLGDAYMRQGRLQEALDAYRSALNQL